MPNLDPGAIFVSLERSYHSIIEDEIHNTFDDGDMIIALKILRRNREKKGVGGDIECCVS
ncbi:MAG TPA: hypothetical protein VN239_05300 [Nitrososphaera sp.]|nr:hypothetical protein [Nitrososphaera sp.]